MQPRSQCSSGGWSVSEEGLTLVHLREASRKLRMGGRDELITGGFQIVESKAMIEAGPMEARVRPLSERLFCLPWRPFQMIKMVQGYRPRKDIIRLGDRLIMHPEVAHQIRLAAELHG